MQLTHTVFFVYAKAYMFLYKHVCVNKHTPGYTTYTADIYATTDKPETL